MIDRNWKPLPSIDKINKAIDLQKQMVMLIYESFDDYEDFQYINLALALTHASKIKDFLTKDILDAKAITKALIEHVSNTEALVEKAEFEDMKKH